MDRTVCCHGRVIGAVHDLVRLDVNCALRSEARELGDAQHGLLCLYYPPYALTRAPQGAMRADWRSQIRRILGYCPADGGRRSWLALFLLGLRCYWGRCCGSLRTVRLVPSIA